MTPFKIVYGRNLLPLIQYVNHSTTNYLLEELSVIRDLMITVLKDQLVLAQDRMKKAADLHRRELEFQVGDMVYLKLRPIANNPWLSNQMKSLPLDILTLIR